MPSTTLGRITAGVAGTAGTSSIGVSAFATIRMASAHAVPAGIWLALAALAAAAALTGSLGLILEYRLRKLEAQSATELKKARLDMHRTVLEKAAGEPGSAQSYRELILADALYLSVEQNGAQLTDKTHEHLYGPGRGGPSPAGELPQDGQLPVSPCHRSAVPRHYLVSTAAVSAGRHSMKEVGHAHTTQRSGACHCWQTGGPAWMTAPRPCLISLPGRRNRHLPSPRLMSRRNLHFPSKIIRSTYLVWSSQLSIKLNFRASCVT